MEIMCAAETQRFNVYGKSQAASECFTNITWMATDKVIKIHLNNVLWCAIILCCLCFSLSNFYFVRIVFCMRCSFIRQQHNQLHISHSAYFWLSLTLFLSPHLLNVFMVTKFILNLYTNRLSVFVCVWLQMVLSAGDQTDLILVNFANVFQCKAAQLQLVWSFIVDIVVVVFFFVCC